MADRSMDKRAVIRCVLRLVYSLSPSTYRMGKHKCMECDRHGSSRKGKWGGTQPQNTGDLQCGFRRVRADVGSLLSTINTTLPVGLSPHGA